MGSSSSSAKVSEAANDAVKAAARAWAQVAADLNVALSESNQAADKVDAVLRRYDKQREFGKKGVANAVRQFTDDVKQKFKGSRLSSKQRDNLIRLQREVEVFNEVLDAAAVKNSKVGVKLSSLVADFEGSLRTLYMVTDTRATELAAMPAAPAAASFVYLA